MKSKMTLGAIEIVEHDDIIFDPKRSFYYKFRLIPSLFIINIGGLLCLYVSGAYLKGQYWRRHSSEM